MVADAEGLGSRWGEAESAYAWLRLSIAVLLAALGSVGMWAYVVALPAVQADFALARADASLPYTLAMIAFGVGAVLIGRLVDRFGIVAPLRAACLLLGLGFIASAFAPNILLLSLAHIPIGIGSSAAFAPLMADISRWFTRRRGIAVAVCAAGNNLGGVLWPPIVQRIIETVGWRPTQMAIGIVCIVAMLPLIAALHRRLAQVAAEDGPAAANGATLRLSHGVLFGLICLAGVACCIAMSMPQVHIVAYCGDLGYGAAPGAQMLALMLGFGIVSRIGSGLLADRIGGLATLLAGSVAQAVALLFYLLVDALTPLYVISALFGLFQGGIVPMYAIVVREYFPPARAGTLVGLAITSTILGMALGGWMSGAILDASGSYWWAFANGLAWNALNAAIVLFLLLRSSGHPPLR